ncbi:ACT domain-containing protein [uncultured Megasphaera sp.]|uniref:ACT domain-containing protein n=1 Tax=uncultured Megasphaera sp. TaxID=165188 RepID=UPI002657B4BB|nr:ACT domain-containing protein [uncultured Megasphaera sp.]
MLHQVSVFAENTKGALHRMTTVLAENGINIYTMLANDSAEFGIIRLIVTDPEKALVKLKEAGYQCRMDRVIAIDMADTPGSLDGILANLEAANVGVDYLYISFNRKTVTPVAVFRTREPEAETFLRGKGYVLLDTI